MKNHGSVVVRTKDVWQSEQLICLTQNDKFLADRRYPQKSEQWQLAALAVNIKH